MYRSRSIRTDAFNDGEAGIPSKGDLGKGDEHHAVGAGDSEDAPIHAEAAGIQEPSRDFVNVAD